ncbi:hypothetical protein V2J56_13990 [Georgenia sp. MJ206]|uniref:hypothetical protein n=1 Tax=Georgenia wangjunii TaxID=3117730 RepID=UPI002F26B1CE
MRPLVRSRVTATVVAGAVMGLVAGCDGGAVVEAGDVTVLVSEPLGYGMDALLVGRLEVVGGCLGAGGSVVVWPEGTQVVNEDPVTISIPGEGTFTVGDDVEVGGGYVHEPGAGTSGSGPSEVGGVGVPAACAAYGVFLASPGR